MGQLEQCFEPLFCRISGSICSNHFQVAERALFLWNNDIIATFTSDHRKRILPIIYPALQKNYSKHWKKSCTRRWPKPTKMDGKHPRSSNKRETQNGEPSNKWAPAADEREQQLSKQDISSYYDY